MSQGPKAAPESRKLFFSKNAKKKKPLIAVRHFAGAAHYVEPVDSVRVAHLTDMHFGRVTPERVQREAIRLVNESNPGLVVITGDFVCHSQMYLDQMTAVLSELDAPVIGVLGNHDYWSGHQEVRKALRRADVEVLTNANTTVTIGHDRLQVVGLDDAYTGHADRDKALKGLRKDIPALGLSHIAEEADALWDAGVPLVLAGHTHAGQVTLAKLHELAIGKLAGHRYVHGLYGSRSLEEEPAKGAVYVGAGIGAAVIPLRLGERGQRELALFELGHEIGSVDEHHEEQNGLPGRKPSAKTRTRRNAFVKEREAKRRAKKKVAKKGS